MFGRQDVVSQPLIARLVVVVWQFFVGESAMFLSVLHNKRRLPVRH